MNEKEISKFMSYVLRHKPEAIGLNLTEDGWADVTVLIEKMNAKGYKIDMALLEHIVAINDKKRFAFNESKTRIRASQGHSINIELGLQPVEPPAILYHGTVERFISAIQQEGLQKMSRQHVHLSKDLETATKFASRRGKPVMLTVHSGKMYQDGYLFYLSENGVWLTDNVAVDYIAF